jgi:hypothetical protein
MFTSPFDETRLFSYGVSYFRIPDADAVRLRLSELKDDPERTGKLCQEFAKMCFPRETDDLNDISLTHHYSPATPQYDRRPWIARLESHENATTASYLGLFQMSKTDEKGWDENFWIGVQCGAPHASRDLMDEVRKTCVNDAPSLLMDDFVRSSQAKFVARAGYRTRTRLLASAWRVLLKMGGFDDEKDDWGVDDHASVYFRNRYDIRWPAVSAVLREDGADEGEDDDWTGDIERLLPPTIDYATHSIEIDNNECIYYSNAFNAKKIIEERGMGNIIVSDTPRIGSALIQYNGRYNDDELPRWLYPYAFPASPGVSLVYQQVLRFEPQSIAIPERALRAFDAGTKTGTAYTNNTFFGFPVTSNSTWPTRVLNHRITLPGYYRTRKTLNMLKYEERLGLPFRGTTQTELRPLVYIIPGTFSFFLFFLKKNLNFFIKKIKIKKTRNASRSHFILKKNKRNKIFKFLNF